MAELFTFSGKSAPEMREDALATIRYMLIRQGVANPNVGPDSDYYAIATAFANECAVAVANGIISCDAQMPDTATDDAATSTFPLSRIGKILGLSPRVAQGSIGFVVMDTTAPTAVNVDDELQDALSQRYRVTVGGTYADNVAIPIQAVATGRATNLAEGSALRWVRTPAYANDTALVATGGLVNGTDDETNEEFRQRIFAFFQSPPGSGNASQVAMIAEAADARVQKAFVTPAPKGPGTVHVAVTASPTATNKSRQVAAAIMSGIVQPYVIGQLPEHIDVTVTTVADTPTDVAFGLAIPEAPTASPPGPGQGWLDGTPWPAVDATHFKVAVTSVASSVQFTCDAQTAPTAGVTRIMWLSPLEWKLYTAKVVSVLATTPGAVQVVVDTPLVGLMVGALIWPACKDGQLYVDATLAAYGLMGPGEKTANGITLARAFRRPRPNVSYPYALGGHLTGALSKVPRVSTASFLYRSDGFASVTGPGGTLAPQPPATITDPPLQYIPRHLAFYRIP